MKTFKILLIMVLLLSACSPAAPTKSPSPSHTLPPALSPTQTSTHLSTPLPSKASAPTGTPTSATSEYCEQVLANHKPSAGYQTYCDKDYGFAFDYPEGWRITFVTGSSDDGDPQWVRKAQRFEAADMSNYIRVDTKSNTDTLSLLDQVHNFFSYNYRIFPDADYPSLTLGGQRAYAIMNCWQQDYSAVYLFFQHGQHYSIMELKAISRDGLDTNWQIARSLQIPGSTADKNVIPQELIDDSYQLLSCNLPSAIQPPSESSTAGNPVLERVAQLGGSISGITIVGNVAFVGMGSRVAAIDISQRQSPRSIGQSRPLPGLVTQLLTVSATASNRLVVNAGKYLVVMDTSNPEALEPLSQIELPGAITTLVLDPDNAVLYAGGLIKQASYQYSGQYSGFIASIDISLVDNPKLLDTVALPAQPLSMALGEGSLFESTGFDTGGLYRIELNSPGELSTPHLVIASVDDYFAPYRMQVIGDRLYAGVNMELQAYDITNPDEPALAWKEFIGFGAKGFSTNGTNLDIFGWAPAGAYIPAHVAVTPPEPVTGKPIGQVASDVAVQRGDFLVAYHNLEIYSSVDFTLVGSFQSPVSSVLGAAVDGHTVYVVDAGAVDSRDQATLRLFSLPDLEPLGQVKTEIPSSCCWFSGITVESDRAYIASTDGLWVYDVSGKTPGMLATPDIVEGQLNSIAAVQIDGQRLLFTAQEASDLAVLTVYDLTDLQKPVKIGSSLYLDRGMIFQMTWNGSSLYAILSATTEDESDRLYVVSFHDNALVLQGKFSLPGSVFSMAVNDGMVAMAGTEGLSIASTADPQSPQLLSRVALPDIGGQVGLLENHVIVIAGGAGGFPSAASLQLFDLQTPANPLQVQALDIASNDTSIGPMAVSAPYIILTGGSSGIDVLEYQRSSPALTVNPQTGAESFFETLFDIPVGKGSLQYLGGDAPDSEVYGPNAIAVLPDGSFMLADPVGDRLWRYDSRGQVIQSMDLNALGIENISDLRANSTDLFVLEIRNEKYRVNRLSFAGDLKASYDIPKGFHIENGLTGIAVDCEGEILLEITGGSELYRLVDAQGNVDTAILSSDYYCNGKPYHVINTAGPGGNPKMIAGNQILESQLSTGFGGLWILDVFHDGSFYVIREDVVTEYVVQVDQTVHYISAYGMQ